MVTVAEGSTLGLDPVLLEVVRCPACRGSLAVDIGRSALTCAACRLAYPVRDGVPVLLGDEAAPLDEPAPPDDNATGERG